MSENNGAMRPGSVAGQPPSPFAPGFTADVVLQASVINEPIRGSENVQAVLAAAGGLYESLAITHQAVHGQRSYLEFDARAFGGKQLLGVIVLERRGDGKIVDLAIHHRPLGAALEFSSELRKRVGSTVGMSYFHEG